VDLLKTTTFAVEGVVISTCAVAAVQIATAHGGDITACLPIATIAAIESLRVPVAMRLPKLKPLGASLGAALLIGITPITFEGMSLAFEQFMHQRVIAVAKAEEKLDKAARALDGLKAQTQVRADELAGLTQQVAEAEKHRTDIGGQTVTLQALPKSQTCRSRKGGTYACGTGAANAAVAANAQAQKAHARDLEGAEKSVQEARQALVEARSKAGPDMHTAEADFADARRDLSAEKADSVMHRSAAAWFGATVDDLSRQQFEVFKKWAMYGLAGATATVTMLAGFISAAPEHDGEPSKLARMARAWLAARRKKLRQLVPTVQIEYRDREIFVHIPVDAITGQIVDRKPVLHVVEAAE
jgi:hypothetical protein